jgi:hypothetical protein
MMEISFHPHCNPFPSTLQQPSKMELANRVVAGGAWDRLVEEIISMIAVKVAETSEAPLEDLRSLRLCNKVTKRACSSCAITNRFNLENHYHSMSWGDGGMLDAYLQTVD